MTTETLTLSGYDDRKELLAQRFVRAGKSLFVVALPLHLVPSHLPVPDPEEPFEGNRRVARSHAAKFGEYWRENEKWATPPLLLDTLFPLSEEFQPKFKAGGVEFGILKLPHNSAGELDILDGQHRILGWTIVAQQLAEELKRAREALQNSRAAEDPAGIEHNKAKVARLDLEVARLRNEYITLEILEGITVAEHKQYFHDIAVNAKGITKSITVSFDRRNVMNRVALLLAEEHRLLVGRTDFEKDRVMGGNENFVSGRNLVDIVKHVLLGIDGRMTVRREKAFKDTHVEAIARQFLDALMEHFPLLVKLTDDEIHPVDLRAKSLLGSATILRVLAGAYHELAVDLTDEDDPRIDEAGHARAGTLFAKLSKHMALPIEQGWLDTGFFPDEESRAPSSRAQDLRGLTDVLVTWGERGRIFV